MRNFYIGSTTKFIKHVENTCLKCLLLSISLLSVQLRGQTVDSFDPVANAPLYTVAVQTDGKVVIGGLFTTVAGQTCNRIARMNVDGTLDTTFNSTANERVYCLAVQPDDKIIVGGLFTTLGGKPRNLIGRLNSDGTADVTFNTEYQNGANGTVYSTIVQTDGKILVSGTFSGLGGQTRNRIGRLNADGTLDISFSPSANGFVYCVALQLNGKILLGGNFTEINGVPRSGIARLETDGTLDATFNPGADKAVYSLVEQADGKILVGGFFNGLGGQPRNFIGRLNSNGSIDSFNPGADLTVRSIALQANGKIIVAGAFQVLAGVAQSRIGRINSNGTADSSFQPGATADVVALAIQPDGKILAGGSFTTLGGQTRSGIGRFNNPDAANQILSFTGSIITWVRNGSSPEASHTRFSISTNGSTWIDLGAGQRIGQGWWKTGLNYPSNATIRAWASVSGGYQNGSSWLVETSRGRPSLITQPQSQTNVPNASVAFTAEARGSVPLSYQWRKNGIGLQSGGKFSGVTNLMLNLTDVSGGESGSYTVVVSNSFGSVTSIVATLKVLDPLITNQPTARLVNVGETVTLTVGTTGTLPSYRWRKDGIVLPTATGSSLVITNAQLEHRGSYDVIVSNTYSSVTSTVAGLSVNIAMPDSLTSTANGQVMLMVPQPDGKILVGGLFGSLNGVSRSYMGRFNADGTLDLDFNPGTSYLPSAFALQADSKIIVGGNFSSIAGDPRNYIGRLNGDGSLDSTFITVPQGSVASLAVQPDGKVLVGGFFSLLNGQPINKIGRLNSDGTVDSNFNAPPPNGEVSHLAITREGDILIGGSFTTVGGLPRLGLARLTPLGALDPSFTPAIIGSVSALLIQTNGQILIGGSFYTVAGVSRRGLARLNSNGTIDSSFTADILGESVQSLALRSDGMIYVGGTFTNLAGHSCTNIGLISAAGAFDERFIPAIDKTVLTLAVQKDGKVIVGGWFSKVAGTHRDYIARLENIDTLTNELSLSDSTITWKRGKSNPEVWSTIFETSTDGTHWTYAGTGSRNATGWECQNVLVPENASIRAIGFVVGDGSSWVMETILPMKGSPQIIANNDLFGFRTNRFGFTVGGSPGQMFILETSTNLSNWVGLETNLLNTHHFYYSDPDSTSILKRFYRVSPFNP